MRFIDVGKLCRLSSSAVFAAIPIILVGCGGGVSEEKFAEVVNNLQVVQSELQVAESRMESLEADKSDLQTKVAGVVLEDIGKVLSINELMVFPPTVVELGPDSASLQMVTSVPTTCSIAHGITTGYGQISNDESLVRGGHTDHYHVIEGLDPDTVYHYRWGLLGPNGLQYGSEDLTFKTPPGGAGASQ